MRRRNIVESDEDDSVVDTVLDSESLRNGDQLSDGGSLSPQRPVGRAQRLRALKHANHVPEVDTADNEDVENRAPGGDAEPQPDHHSKKPRTHARKSVRANRASLAAASTIEKSEELGVITPRASVSPEAQVVNPPTPLNDITGGAINGRTEQKEESQYQEKKTAAATTVKHLEKPMDIVVRTRARGVPQVHAPAEPRARMVITYLTLTNFKSYAGRQEVGPFHASFSSVVGPNGSGKSNVIDSLLFVFGFRASKMRQGKISSLIHNSAAHPDLEYCEVEVHFQKAIDQESGEKTTLPESKVVVSRRAFKNNSSKYYINGAESNFTTVTTMLREEGIDLDHKRFLILQGEVESIAQMKPKAANEHDDGLLEYLEDIIGTSKYKTPIEESATELENLNEVCREKNTRMEHVDREKSGLEGKKNAALGFIKDENDLNQKQSALWQIFIHECEDNIQITDEAVAQQQAQLDAENERHRGGEEEISTINKKFHAEAKQLETMQLATQAILKQLAKADKEAVKFDEKKKHLSNKMKKLEKAETSSSAAISESQSGLCRLKDDMVRNSDSIKALEEELAREEATLGSIREGLKGKTQGFSDEITMKQKSLEPWHAQISEKRSAIAVARSELDMLRERENAGARTIAEIDEKLQQLRKEHAERTQALRSLEKQKEDSFSKSKKTQDAVDRVSTKEPEARAKLSASRQKVDEARASLSTVQTQGNVLNALMRLKDSGRISGFHGRLGNLGAIDQKYDVAISTACPALDNLVVDSVEVGQQCIDFLRKGNLGRANFILLDRLGNRDMSSVSTPEGVPRLFDLVNAKDEKFLPAFYSVLQNTLVAKDLEQANRVAYGAKRWRVVTLDGKLIDKSGTMSGGGTRTAKGAMSAKLTADVSKEQVAKLERDHEHEEKKWQEFQEERDSLVATLKNLQDQTPALETQMQRCSLEAESIRGNIQDMEKRQAELASDQVPANADSSRIDKLEASIQRHEDEIISLGHNTQGLEEEIRRLQEKIMEIGGVKLRGQKAKVDGFKEQLSTLNEEVANAEAELSKTEKALAKHEKSRLASQNEIASVQTELERLDGELKKQDGDTSGVRAEADEAQERLDSKREEIGALRAEVERRTTELNESRGAEIDMKNRLEENQKALHENTKRLKYWQDKLEKLTVQNVSESDATIEEQGMTMYTRDELTDLDKGMLKGEIAALEEKTQNANVDLGVLAEYRRRVEELAARTSDLNEAVTQRDTAKKRCEDLRRIRLEGFMEGFSTISLRLKEMYQMITMGGNAELELVDSLDPFSEGILFSVMPPKKSWKNISNLSGGEKTLSSLALVFALHHYKPTPLYVMDEIDAALDFRNVSIVASYIKERTKNAQFIVISLRNNMFELASRLVGVYKVNHMTKSVTVENHDFIERGR